MGSSREDLTAFPKSAKSIAGHQLNRLERGLQPDHFKWMPEVGPGAAEIIVDIGDQYRVFYVAKFKTGIYVLHAFEKKTQKTTKHDIDLGAKRFRDAELVEKSENKKEEKQ